MTATIAAAARESFTGTAIDYISDYAATIAHEAARMAYQSGYDDAVSDGAEYIETLVIHIAEAGYAAAMKTGASDDSAAYVYNAIRESSDGPDAPMPDSPAYGRDEMAAESASNSALEDGYYAGDEMPASWAQSAYDAAFDDGWAAAIRMLQGMADIRRK